MARKNEPALPEMTEEEIVPEEVIPSETVTEPKPGPSEPMPEETGAEAGNLEQHIDTAMAMVDEGLIPREKASAIAVFLMNRGG